MRSFDTENGANGLFPAPATVANRSTLTTSASSPCWRGQIPQKSSLTWIMTPDLCAGLLYKTSYCLHILLFFLFVFNNKQHLNFNNKSLWWLFCTHGIQTQFSVFISTYTGPGCNSFSIVLYIFHYFVSTCLERTYWFLFYLWLWR